MTLMESDFDEDVSTLSRPELRLRQERLSRDKRFVTYKRQYWNRISAEIMELEKRIVHRNVELKNTCDLCGVKIDDDDKDRLRTLPTNEKVCKPCWKRKIDEKLISNANSMMVSNQ